jgi:long-chain fatty acid transport protein
MDGMPHPVEDTNGLYLGADLPLPFGGVLADRLALGVAFYFPTTVLDRALAPYPDVPRLALLDARTQVVSVLAGLAARIHPRFTVGIGLLVLATLVGDIRIAPDSAGHITTLSEEQVVVRYAPVIGARVRVLPSLRIGAVFRGESKADYDIDVYTSLGDVVPLQIPKLTIAGVAQYDPMQAALEAAWRPVSFFDITGGLTWKHWSAFPSPTENATEATPPQAPPNFHDTVVPRIAVELSKDVGPVTLRARLGYFFEWSPAPLITAASVLLDADRHVFTVGGGAELHHRYGTLQLDLFGQLHHLAGQTRADGDFYFMGLTVGEDL